MIPRRIHQIWIGKPMPRHLAHYCHRWRELHPSWEYRLWREEDLRGWLRNQASFDQAATLSPRNVGQFASNIARLEILLHHGGVYIDTDMEPRKAIDPLLDDVEAFTAWHPATEDYDDHTYLTNALMGAVPSHPVFASLVAGLPENIERSAGLRSVYSTGVRYMTARLQAEGLMGAMTVYPAPYFYPYGTDELDKQTRVPADRFKESYAVHRWNNRISGRWAGRAA